VTILKKTRDLENGPVAQNGEVKQNSKGSLRAVGRHTLIGGNVAIVAGTETDPDDNGVYLAKASVAVPNVAYVIPRYDAGSRVFITFLVLQSMIL